MPNTNKPTLAVLAAALCSSSVAAYADTANDVRHWYEKEYAPLWFSVASADPARVREFYTTPYRRHPIDSDSFLRDNSVEYWREWIDSIIADGWVGGDLIRVDVTELNRQAVYVFAQWRDKGIEEPQSLSCDSYIVARSDGHWRISNYISTSCE